MNIFINNHLLVKKTLKETNQGQAGASSFRETSNCCLKIDQTHSVIVMQTSVLMGSAQLSSKIDFLRLIRGNTRTSD